MSTVLMWNKQPRAPYSMGLIVATQDVLRYVSLNFQTRSQVLSRKLHIVRPLSLTISIQARYLFLATCRTRPLDQRILRLSISSIGNIAWGTWRKLGRSLSNRPHSLRRQYPCGARIRCVLRCCAPVSAISYCDSSATYSTASTTCGGMVSMSNQRRSSSLSRFELVACTTIRPRLRRITSVSTVNGGRSTRTT